MALLNDAAWAHLGEQSRFLPITPIPPGRVGIVGYSRVSTLLQAMEGMSIDAQISNIREYAEKHNYIIKTICVDLGLSGGTADRPGLQMARLVLGPGDLFVIPSLSRMSRKVEDAMAIKNELQAKGCGFVILDLAIDIREASGQLVFGLLNQFNEFERKEIQGRISVVMKAMARNGTLIKKPMYGYMSTGKKKHLVPHPEEQRVIQYLLELTAEHPTWGPSKYARLLNEHPEFSDQAFHRKSAKWYPAVVRNILLDVLERAGRTPGWDPSPGRKKSDAAGASTDEPDEPDDSDGADGVAA